MQGAIRVGPAGWSYKDWTGIVYPEKPPPRFDPLSYLADYFDTIEINSSFYRPPSVATARSWVKRIDHNKNFRFTAKLYQAFTHQRGKATAKDESAFKAGIDPIASGGRLGAVLLQFPWSFKNEHDSREYLGQLFSRFSDYPLVLEVRHASWNEAEVYEWLNDAGVGFCNIDQPLFAKSIKPSARATSRIGYVRLHGRNYQHWFAETTDDPRDRAERYNYLYSPQELLPWVEKIRQVADQAMQTYVVTNNHFEGKGIVNALEIESLLLKEKVPGPAILFETYPRIKDSVIPMAKAEHPQLPLFQ